MGAPKLSTTRRECLRRLMDMTGGRGPDACIDDFGMEAHAPAIINAYDRVKQAMMLETDRPHALREAIMCCRNGGVVSVIGVYGGLIDKFPIGSVMQRSLTIRTDKPTCRDICDHLLQMIRTATSIRSFVVTHTMDRCRRSRSSVTMVAYISARGLVRF